MAKVNVHNNTDCSMHIGPVTIPPGMTREVDEAYLSAPEPAEPAPVPPTIEALEAKWIAETVERSIKEISELLPAMTDEQLASIEAAEQAKGDAARKGLLELVAKTKLERAANGAP